MLKIQFHKISKFGTYDFLKSIFSLILRKVDISRIFQIVVFKRKLLS